MRRIKISAYVKLIALFAMPFFVSCGGNNVPKTGTVKVKPYDDLPRAGTYCKYEVTGAPSEGVAAIKVGEIVCVLCAAGKNGCDNYSKVEMEDGTTYPVKALTNGLACTSCPAGTDTPAGYAFQEQ